MTVVVAHRGASAARQENTLEAFAHAVTLGADWVELDVRRSADGALVVHHDATLADGRVIVETATADLPASVAALADVFDAADGLAINLEIKNDVGEPDHDPGLAIAEEVVALARRYRSDDALLFTTFDEGALRRLRGVDPTLPVGLLLVEAFDIEATVQRAVDLGVVAISPHHTSVNAALIDAAHDAGLQVNTWTVNSPERMRQLVDAGLDGLVTDVPDIGRAVVDQVTDGRA